MNRHNAREYLRNPPSTDPFDTGGAFPSMGSQTPGAFRPGEATSAFAFVVGDRIEQPGNSTTWGVVDSVGSDGLRVGVVFHGSDGRAERMEMEAALLMQPQRMPDGSFEPPWRVVGCAAPGRSSPAARPRPASYFEPSGPFSFAYQGVAPAAAPRREHAPVPEGDFTVALLQGSRGGVVGEPQTVQQDMQNPKTNANVAATVAASLTAGSHFMVLNRATGNAQKYVVITEPTGDLIAAPVGKPKKYGTAQLRRNGSGEMFERVPIPDFPGVFGLRAPGAWVANDDAADDDTVYLVFTSDPLNQLAANGSAEGVLVSAQSSKQAADRAMPLFARFGIRTPSRPEDVFTVALEAPVAPSEGF